MGFFGLQVNIISVRKQSVDTVILNDVTYMYTQNVITPVIQYTVKPVLRGHPRGHTKLAA